MRDFRAGSQDSGEYTENRKWNLYAGEEESGGESCGGICSSRMRDGSEFSMRMPELNEEEQRDVMRWGSQRPVPSIMEPERKKRPPKYPMPGGPTPNRPMPIPEWGNGSPERPMPGRPTPNRPMPIPEWGNEPPERPMPGRPAPNRPMPMPEWGNEPPERPKPGRPAPNRPMPGRPWPDRLRTEWEDYPVSGSNLTPEEGIRPDWKNPAPEEGIRTERKNPAPEEGIRLDRKNPAVESRNGAPYFRYDYETVIEDEKKREQDLRMLQSMYPAAVKEILPCVEEICDRMEYEGSTMFDEYPDKNTVRRLSDEIYRQTGDVWPRETIQEPDGVMSMQYQEGARGPLGELIQILLLQEMHHRRCRHRRCRPHMF